MIDKKQAKNFINNLFEFLASDSGESLEEMIADLKESGIDFYLAKERLDKVFMEYSRQED